MALDALIFDVDGTLVDTNSFHVAAWKRAFSDCDYQIKEDRIAQEIGKGGDQLVSSILGDSAEKQDGERLRELYGEHFLDIAAREKFAVLPGAIELMKAARKRGLKVALATSAEREYLDAIEKSCGTKFSDLADLVTTASDAEKSKPAPDIVAATVEKLGFSPAQCAMVGDTIYDAEACRAAGVVCLAVLSGGNEAEKLLAAGARGVWQNCAAIEDDFAAILEAAAPGETHWTGELLEKLMREALEVAQAGMDAGEAPIGAVLARGVGQNNYEIIARGYNSMNATQNKTAHAEIVCFANAAAKVPLDCRDLVLVSNLEPCVMCFGAAAEAAVDLIVYALPAPFDSGTHRVAAPQSPESQMPRIVGRILEKESRRLFEKWLETHKNSEQASYIKQLLG